LIFWGGAAGERWLIESTDYDFGSEIKENIRGREDLVFTPFGGEAIGESRGRGEF
jgi:hypothetical protein